MIPFSRCDGVVVENMYEYANGNLFAKYGVNEDSLFTTRFAILFKVQVALRNWERFVVIKVTCIFGPLWTLCGFFVSKHVYRLRIIE